LEDFEEFTDPYLLLSEYEKALESTVDARKEARSC